MYSLKIVCCSASILAFSAASAQAKGLAEGLLTLLVAKDFRQCASKVEDSPAAQSIKNKYPLMWNNITARDMAIQSRPTPQEVHALINVNQQGEACRQAVLEKLSVVNPEARRTVAQGYAASDQVFTALISGNLTWGQANAYRKKISQQMDNASETNTAGGPPTSTYQPYRMTQDQSFKNMNTHSYTGPWLLRKAGP